MSDLLDQKKHTKEQNVEILIDDYPTKRIAIIMNLISRARANEDIIVLSIAEDPEEYIREACFNANLGSGWFNIFSMVL